MPPTLIFDLDTAGFGNWWVVAIPGTMTVIGLAGYLACMDPGIRKTLQLFTRPDGFPVQTFFLIFGGFAAMMTGIWIFATVPPYLELKKKRASGQCPVVLAPIREFNKKQIKTNLAEVTFAVGNARFFLKDTDLHSGYVRTSGPLSEGMLVRIEYCRGMPNVIVRLEILKSPSP